MLTSFDQTDVHELGYTVPLNELVAERVRQAVDAGLDGIVGSPLEARAIRAAAGPDKILVFPGVRSAGAEKGDQKRVATPAEAMANGADYLVIGRQVTRAADPAVALAEIHEEIYAVAR